MLKSSLFGRSFFLFPSAICLLEFHEVVTLLHQAEALNSVEFVKNSNIMGNSIDSTLVMSLISSLIP